MTSDDRSQPPPEHPDQPELPTTSQSNAQPEQPATSNAGGEPEQTVTGGPPEQPPIGDPSGEPEQRPASYWGRQPEQPIQTGQPWPSTASYPAGQAQPTAGFPTGQPSQAPAAWNPVTGMSGWDPKVGPPGWSGQPAYTPPQVPPHQHTRGLSPFGMPARHSWEIPLLVIVVTLTVFAYMFATLLLIFGEINQYVLLLMTAPLLLWIGRGMNYATMRVNGVRMSPTQFPEGYRMVQEAAARFGMDQVPDAYVVLGNGAINAFASGHGFRRFVVVYSDLFEIGGAAREPDGLAFIIGHEVGHIAAGHVSYWRQAGMFLVPFLPILGNSLIRSQEFTADNHGFCNRHTGAPAAMRTLAAGKYLNTLVGFDEMADRAAYEKGGFVWLVNAMSSHPVLTWRMWALRDRSRHGKLFLRPDPPMRPTPIPGGPPPGGFGGPTTGNYPAVPTGGPNTGSYPVPNYGGPTTGSYPVPPTGGYGGPNTGSYPTPPTTGGYQAPPPPNPYGQTPQ